MRGGIVDRFLKEQLADADIVEQLYLRTLCRPPSEKEKQYCVQTLASATQKRDAIEDMLWALLNSREFVYNN
jgi:hypothetical protein